MNQHGHTPLVVFTSLAMAGAGLVAVDPVLRGSAHAAASNPALTAGVVLQALALVVSLLHLGRKDRASLAARGTLRSPLSNEIVMAAAALAASAALLALGWSEPAPAAMRVLAGALCAGFLVAIGLVYRIPGQLTWMGPAALTPLSAGGAFGAVCIQALAASPDGVPRAVVAVLGIDAAIFLLRWQEAAALDVSVVGRVAGPFWPWRHQWFFARFFLLDVVPIALLLFWPTPIVIAVAAGGLVVDRLAFYGLAVQHTTEREVERVDAAIRAASQRRGD